MNTKDFERRIKLHYGDLVFTCSDGYRLTITLENRDSRQVWVKWEKLHLIIEKVDELKAAIADWEKLYYNAAESNDD